MRKLGHDLGFAIKMGFDDIDVFFIKLIGKTDGLDRCQPVKNGILALIDNSHRPPADLFQNFIPPQLRQLLYHRFNYLRHLGQRDWRFDFRLLYFVVLQIDRMLQHFYRT